MREYKTIYKYISYFFEKSINFEQTFQKELLFFPFLLYEERSREYCIHAVAASTA